MHIVLFLSGFIFLCIQILRLKKTDTKVSGVSWIILSIITTMAIQALTAGLFGVVKMPISNLTIGISDWVIGALLYYLCQKYGVQEYKWIKWDFLTIGILLAGTFVVGFITYGINLEIAFVASDPAAHMLMAKEFAIEHFIPSNMYFAGLQDGLLMEVLYPLLGYFDLYKSFVLSELVWFFLSGATFYTCINLYCEKTSHYIIAMIVTIFYWLGYPLYAIQFGFTYLGVAIILITYIVTISEYAYQEHMNDIFTIFAWIISLYGLIVCYTLFVPVVYLGVFIFIVWMAIKKSQKFNWFKIMKREMIVFAIPVLLGLFYSYVNVKEISGTSGGGIVKDGGCYNDSFSSFILILPLILYGYFSSKQEDRYRIVQWILYPLLVFMAVMFFLGMRGQVSAYYYSKNNSVLWLLAFIYVFISMINLMAKNRIFAKSIGISIVCIGVMFVGVENWVINHYPRFIETPVANFLGVYTKNKQVLNMAPISHEKLELMAYVYENYSLVSIENTLAVTNEVEGRWYHSITDQKNYIVYGDLRAIHTFLEDENIRYVMVFYDSDFHQNYGGDIQVMGNFIYQNDAGYILALE